MDYKGETGKPVSLIKGHAPIMQKPVDYFRVSIDSHDDHYDGNDDGNFDLKGLKPLSDNPSKWSNTLKQFVSCYHRIV